MVRIAFRVEGGGERIVDAEEGQSLLETALANGIAGIIGDCGGEMSCGTCHAYVDQAWLSKLPPPSPDEQIMIEDGVIDPKPNSRLCCQIIAEAGLDGMRLDVPKQY